jgi:hypothetical protein
MPHDASFSLYQSHSINRKKILQSKLRSIVMTKSNIITNYLMKLTHIHDQLEVVGEKLKMQS